MISTAVIALAVLPYASAILPVATPNCLAFSESSNVVTLLAARQRSGLPPILTSQSDWAGVRRAADDLAMDFKRTTGTQLPIHNLTVSGSGSKLTSSVKAPAAIIVGTIGMSPEIDAMVSAGKIDVSAVQGKWEAFMLKHVSAPLAGINDALVIAGADKRGSIFGLYTLSEQLGVSPWWFWTDTPSTQRKNGVFILKNSDCGAGSPTVQYRGIFINDEQPSLTNWANEKLRPAGSNLASFRSNFYVLMFEVILRLKANYLWPAIWNSMFAIDDDTDQFTADLFGVVMGTSHQEPMMRSTPNEFNLFLPGQNYDFNTNAANITEYWRVGAQRAKPFESLYSMGMRGNGDLPLGPTTNIALLENIISTQRGIIASTYNITDQTAVPQMWALYKEVQNYYNDGMRVDDDITLLWTDDNWGHIQRLPSDAERSRWGGAGVYFHADYVGDPVDYKWINSVNNVQSFQQLNLAIEFNSTRIWILNVGDFKGNEIPTDFFLSMAYNASAFTRSTMLDYQTRWAEREFGSTTLAPQIATIVQNFTRLTAMRKPELTSPTTFSLINYREADTIASQWAALADSATALAKKLPSAAQSAFFQTVLHPVKATANLHQLYIAAGKNNLFTSRASSSANAFMTQAMDMFNVDVSLRNQYHSLEKGKWNHMMDQTHFGYFYWQQPMQDTLPPMSFVFQGAPALAGTMRLSVENSLGAWPGDNMNDCAQEFNCPPPTLLSISPFGPTSRYVEISPSGPTKFSFNTTVFTPWLKVSVPKGTLHPQDLPQRVELSVDWTKFPTDESLGLQNGVVLFASTTGESVNVTLPAIRTSVPSGFHGFVEGDGVVSMEAAHFTSSITVDGVSFVNVPSFGTRVFDGLVNEPSLVNNITPKFAAGAGPTAEYSFFTFNTLQGGKAATLNVTTYIYSSFNLIADDTGAVVPLAFGITIDDQPLQTVNPVPPIPAGNNVFVPPDWDGLDGAAANAVRMPINSFTNVGPGQHTLKISMITPGLIFEKIVIDVGGLLESYLGPPESTQV